MGVAAVSYFGDSPERDSIGNPSTTMLGCACIDSADHGVQIQCSMVLYGGSSTSASNDNIRMDHEASKTLQVYFQQRSTAKYFTCQQMEISIQSVRWPVTRFTKQYKSEYEGLKNTDMIIACV